METAVAPPIVQPTQQAQVVQPDTGNSFDITPMWERFETHQKAQAEAKSKEVEKPTEAAKEPEKGKEQAQAKTEEKVEKPDEAAKSKEQEEDLPPGVKTEAAKENWKTLKAELKELREKKIPETEKLANERQIEIETLKKQLAQFEGKDITQYEKKIADLEAREAEWEKDRAINDVAKSAVFRNEILEPAAKIGESMDTLAKIYEANADDLRHALQIPDLVEQRKKLAELTEGWSQIDVADIMQAARDTRMLLAKSQSMLNNAEKTKKELAFISEQEGKKKAESEAATMKAAYESIDKQLLEKFSIIKEKEGLEQQIREAKFEDTPSSRALASKLVPLVKVLNDELSSVREELRKSQEELSKRSQAKPNPSSAGATVTKTEENLPQGNTPDDAMARWAAHQSKLAASR